jgi:hypothetical protein
MGALGCPANMRGVHISQSGRPHHHTKEQRESDKAASATLTLHITCTYIYTCQYLMHMTV